LYSGPAINVLAIILTARVLGLELGLARAIGAIVFSIVLGLAMHLIFHKQELAKADAQGPMPEADASRPLWKNAAFFAAMIGILVFANWSKSHESSGSWQAIYSVKWVVTGFLAVSLAAMLILWFKRGELTQWTGATWGFAKQILPLLLAGVLVAGFLLGRPGHEGLIPGRYVEMLVGDSPNKLFEITGWGGGAFESFARAIWPLWTNFFASVFGAFMYFATLTEVPILQGLIGAGMGKGPALALLLAGPALSLPNMLVIGSVLGARKTVVFISLVVVMATLSGIIFGTFF
ncbi:permease, partial [bacterium]|nr:permease [bacterium]